MWKATKNKLGVESKDKKKLKYNSLFYYRPLSLYLQILLPFLII